MKKSSFKTIKIRTNYFEFFFFVFIDLFLTFGQKILLFRLLSLKPMINSKKYIHNENLRKIQEKRTTIYKNLGRSERASLWRGEWMSVSILNHLTLIYPTWSRAVAFGKKTLSFVCGFTETTREKWVLTWGVPQLIERLEAKTSTATHVNNKEGDILPKKKQGRRLSLSLTLIGHWSAEVSMDCLIN